MKRVAFAGLIASSQILSGCLVSSKPLFPSGALVVQTPLKQGWYLKRTLTPSIEKNLHSVDTTPIFLAQRGPVYDYFEGTKTPTHTFQLFAAKPAESPMVAQAKVGDNVWGYQRIDFNDTRDIFFTIDQRCGSGNRTIDPAGLAMMNRTGIVQIDERSCAFSDAVHVSAAALMAGNWKGADRYMYVRVPESDLVSFKRMKDGPKTLDICAGAHSIQTLDPNLGPSNATAGVRRHAISASKDRLLVVEASGAQFGKWSYLLTRTGDQFQSYCSPDKVISVTAVLPKQSAYTTTTPRERIAEVCSQTTNDSCDTLEAMIASIGDEILVQGTEVLDLPKGEQARGSILTVLGKRGIGSLTVLKTERSGLTRILARY